MCRGDGSGELQDTPVVEAHKKLHATLVDFAGWNMPVQYTSVMKEHTATRTKAGLFDISHMGEFVISGNDTKKFLQHLIVGDIHKLEAGKAMYSIMCYENGTVVDDLFIYQFTDTEFMLVVNACNTEKDLTWIKQHMDKFDVTVSDISMNTGKIDIQGPLAKKILEKVTTAQLPPRFHYIETTIHDVKVVISRTGYTAEDGFEIYTPWDKTSFVWDLLMKEGADYELTPVGLGARDTLRIEACYSLYGHEINDEITPVEAGLGWVVNLDTDFIGKEALKKQKENGALRKLVCFEMVERAVPRENYKIFSEGIEIGFVTSGTFSPTFKKGIGLGLIKKEYGQTERGITIKIRDRDYKAKIVKRPFYGYNG